MESSTNLLYFDEAVKLEKIGQPAEGCSVGYGGGKKSLALCWKTRSKSRVDCKLVDRVVGDYRNADAFALPMNYVCWDLAHREGQCGDNHTMRDVYTTRVEYVVVTRVTLI